MSESRIGDRRRSWIGAGLGLGVVGVLWLLWSSTAEPIAPSPSALSKTAASLGPSPTSPGSNTLAEEGAAREELPEALPRQIQVLDARTIEPVAGATVNFTFKSRSTSSRLSREEQEQLRIKMGQLNSLIREFGSTPTEPLRIVGSIDARGWSKRLRPFASDWPQSGVSDRNGIVTLPAESNLVRVAAVLGDQSGTETITTTSSFIQILIESEITIEVRDVHGMVASNRGVVAFLCVDEDGKGPILPIPKANGSSVLHSPWRELRTWLDSRPYEEAGILIGFDTHPEWPSVWLPIESPVPNPVILRSPPTLPTEVKRR